MKAVYLCHECLATIEVNAKSLPENVSCPNCQEWMKGSEGTVESVILEHVGMKARNGAIAGMRGAFACAVEKLGDNPKVQRRIAKALTHATRCAVYDWNEEFQAQLKKPSE